MRDDCQSHHPIDRISSSTSSNSLSVRAYSFIREETAVSLITTRESMDEDV